MADGFDLLAGEAVLSLQQELRDLRLACIVPFATHGNSGSATYKARYKSVKLCASYYYAIGENPINPNLSGVMMFCWRNPRR